MTKQGELPCIEKLLPYIISSNSNHILRICNHSFSYYFTSYDSSAFYKNWTKWERRTFTESSDKWDCRAHHHPEIWRVNVEITAKVNFLLELYMVGACRWQFWWAIGGWRKTSLSCEKHMGPQVWEAVFIAFTLRCTTRFLW